MSDLSAKLMLLISVVIDEANNAKIKTDTRSYDAGYIDGLLDLTHEIKKIIYEDLKKK